MDNKALLKQLVELITKGNAHATFEHAVADLSFDKLSIKPENVPFNIWMLAEHLRIAQADILDFSINLKYKELTWPDDYWPKEEQPQNDNLWHNCLEQIRKDRDQFVNLISQPAVDLFKPFAHGSGQNLLREALLIADHNSYHTGQIILIRRLLNDWK